MLPTDASWTPSVIADAVRHYPVPDSVNGRRPEQTDFLKDAVRTETWRGLRVRVFHSTSSTWATPSINFHGLTWPPRTCPGCTPCPAPTPRSPAPSGPSPMSPTAPSSS